MEPIKKLNRSSCNYSILPNLRDYPDLEKLNISYNNIYSFDYNNLPPSLKKLDISSNRIFLLSYLPDNIVSLNVSCNKISSFNGSLFTGLQILNISKNKLYYFQFPPNAREVDISNNYLNALNGIMPNSLIGLDCSKNKLVKLPTINDNLEVIDFTDNKIEDSLEITQNSSLKSIYGSHNLMSEITELPLKLEVLELKSNFINAICDIPNGTISINLSNNNLSNFPKLPEGIKAVRLDNNIIENIGFVPNSVRILSLHDNFIPENDKEIADLLQRPKLKLSYLPTPKIEPIPQSILNFKTSNITYPSHSIYQSYSKYTPNWTSRYNIYSNGKSKINNPNYIHNSDSIIV